MTLKEKLELLWKYLLLAIIVFGLAQIGRKHHSMKMDYDCSPQGGEEMMWIGKGDHDFGDMEVDVMIEKLVDGDSTIQVIINGKTMDLKDLEEIEDNVYIKKMTGKHKGKEHKVKIIKKKMSDD